MDTLSCDLFVIGAGSGGIRAARRVADVATKRVVIAEDGDVGGTCVHRGCVPKKIFFYAGAVADEITTARSLGWKIDTTGCNWQELIQAKNQEIDRLGKIYHNLLSKVTLVKGHAVIEDPHHVRVQGRRWRAENILIATGGAPLRLPIEGIEHAITSDEVFHLPHRPQRLIIIGGGYIGIEFASFFRSLGSDVDVLYRSPLPLKDFDADIRHHAAEHMIKRGIGLHPQSAIARIEKTKQGILVHRRSGDPLSADVVLCATGRQPRTAGIGLPEIGIACDDQGHVQVDADYRTTLPHIFAIGDIIDRPALTPVATAQAGHVVAVLRGDKPTPIDYRHIPTAVFCDPPIATLGMTSEEAAQQNIDSTVLHARFRPLKYALRAKDEETPQTLMKWVVDRGNDRVLGLHMMGLDAPEIMQGFVPALSMGMTLEQCRMAIGLHPTSAEEWVTPPSEIKG